jgi:hypothetical protein
MTALMDYLAAVKAEHDDAHAHYCTDCPQVRLVAALEAVLALHIVSGSWCDECDRRAVDGMCRTVSDIATALGVTR